ncbi:MAG TPA: Asp-tRNA(Asn)/Glu-tRNA(Gln) amidotransferase subunit GatB [Veillonellaceae bacterium]|jgi:aspartyl-tRNA(Asn)/glutamyl-tRNA(Gln) amidotransferase subunit C|nr:Asp-tRNA(Asn)/Glu-tRNA(Gln) amidotransferase subunit GatB [Veillonellaceae bacterium]
MKITSEEAKKIALLSRLSFGDEELDKMKSSMNEILTYMEELNQYDTDGTEPTVHAVELYNVMREDIPRSGISHEKALMNAPEQEDGCFKVPKII